MGKLLRAVCRQKVLVLLVGVNGVSPGVSGEAETLWLGQTCQDHAKGIISLSEEL